MYDTIIIGGGPAGVSAALYLRARGRDVLVMEKGEVGGLIGTVSTVSHYAGLMPDESGRTFRDRMERQLRECGATVVCDEAKALDIGDPFVVRTTGETYRSRTVILAVGSERKALGIPGEEAFTRNARDITTRQPGMAFVAGGSDGAAKEALYLARFVPQVHMVEIRNGMFCIDEFRQKIERTPSIIFHKNAHILKAEGDPIRKMIVRDNKTGEDLVFEDEQILAFCYIGQMPKLDFLKGVLPVEEGFLKTGIETPLRGVFAAGDVRAKDVRQVATAVADGCEAAIRCDRYLFDVAKK